MSKQNEVSTRNGHQIIIKNAKCKLENLRRKNPNAVICDLTSNSPDDELRLLSPFYPHGGIPVPFSESMKAACVEGIWQGLKVFEHEDIDKRAFGNDTMKNLKRTVRKFGTPKGHRKGVNGTELLDYIEARRQIYLPTYLWVLNNVPAVRKVLERLKDEMQRHDLVFLDYATNTDWKNPKKPLSHAGLVKMWLEGTYPGNEKTSGPRHDPAIDDQKQHRIEQGSLLS